MKYALNGFDVETSKIESIVPAHPDIFVNTRGVNFKVSPQDAIDLIKYMQKNDAVHLAHILGSGMITLINSKVSRGDYNGRD